MRRITGSAPLVRAARHVLWVYPDHLHTTDSASFQRWRERRDAILNAARLFQPELRELERHLTTRLESKPGPDEYDALWFERDDLRALVGLDASPRPSISDAHADELRRSTIEVADAIAAGIWTEQWSPLVGRMMGREVRAGEYLMFPYFVPGSNDPASYRAKRRAATHRGGSYTGRSDADTPIYFPPRTRASGSLRDVTQPLIVTEGEKKGLCLDRMGLPTIAAPGVWNLHDVHAPRKQRRLHPWILDHVELRNREVIIAFDAGIRTNHDVWRAAQRAQDMFILAGAAVVRVVSWDAPPPPRGVNGVDDLAFVSGDDAVLGLLTAAPTTVPPLWMQVPRRVAARADLTPRQKLAFGALAVHANGDVVRRVTLDVIGTTLGCSGEAAGKLIRALDTKHLVKTRSGQAEETSRGWRKDANSYLLLEGCGDPIYVNPADLVHGAVEALALGALRQSLGNRLRVTQLAEALSIDRTQVYRAARALGPRVTVSRGVIRLT